MRNLLACSIAAILVAGFSASAQQAEPARKTVKLVPAFTAAQAERGKSAYGASCVGCHLAGLDGSANPTANVKGAPLTGPRFVQDFGEQKVSALFNKMKRDMPKDKPGSLTDQQYLDIASYVLQQNSFPAGESELTVDGATDIWIPGAGGAEGLADYTYVSGVGCLSQDPTRSWLLVKAQGLKKTEASASAPATRNAPGEFTFRLLNAYNYTPEPHNGQRMWVSGYLVRLGAEIRIFVQALQPVGTSCDGAPIPASSVAPLVLPPIQQQQLASSPLPAPQSQIQAGVPTVWNGVYSPSQAYSGEKVADTVCLGCHGAGLAGGDSGPKLAGADFLTEWNTRSVGELFNYISEKMPDDAPGTLKKDDVAAVVAYILQVNNMPSGNQNLPPDGGALSQITILATRP